MRSQINEDGIRVEQKTHSEQRKTEEEKYAHRYWCGRDDAGDRQQKSEHVEDQGRFYDVRHVSYLWTVWMDRRQVMQLSWLLSRAVITAACTGLVLISAA